MIPKPPLATPRITVGLTCFNAEQTIERALRSALDQDWPDLEVVVVDDASTDGSWAVIQRCAARDSRVKAARRAVNGGAAATRNTILEMASGEFVAFFDDDDESVPERVRVQFEALRAYEVAHGAVLLACYASGARLYPNGYAMHAAAIGSRPEVPHGEMVADYLLFNSRAKNMFFGAGTPTCALMARRATFEAVGGFDSDLRRVEDVDFAVRLALAGGHFIGTVAPLYRQFATVSADKTPGKNLDAELALLDKHEAYLRQKGRYGYARDWFRLRYYHFSGQRGGFLLTLLGLLLKHPVWGMGHLWRSAPGRWLHERKMRAPGGAQ
ncbi:MAG: glycosyltransferase family 2 protein [Pseudomonadota bacterium]